MRRSVHKTLMKYTKREMAKLRPQTDTVKSSQPNLCKPTVGKAPWEATLACTCRRSRLQYAYIVHMCPETPCDKFVYDLPCDFLGIVGGYGLRHNVFTLSTGIVQFLLRGLGRQPGVNPYRDCAEIVRKSCNVSAVAVQSPQPPHGNRTEPVQGSAFARCAPVRGSAFARCAPVRGLCNSTYNMSTGYGLTIFPNL